MNNRKKFSFNLIKEKFLCIDINIVLFGRNSMSFVMNLFNETDNKYNQFLIKIKANNMKNRDCSDI